MRYLVSAMDSYGSRAGIYVSSDSPEDMAAVRRDALQRLAAWGFSMFPEVHSA